MNNGQLIPGIANAEAGTITFRILIEGKELPQTVELLSIATWKEVNRIPTAQLVIRDGSPAGDAIDGREFKQSSGDKFIPGKEIDIQTGYDAKEETIFKGIIVKQGIKIRERSEPVLVVECQDKSVKMTVGRKNKYFTEVKDSEVIEELIGDYSLQKDVAATSVTHKELVQYYSTDWDFMLSRAQMSSSLVMVNDGKITVKPPDFGQSPKLQLNYGGNMYEFEAEMDARYQYQSVEANAWDHTNQELLTEEGKAKATNEQGNLTSKKLSETIGLSTFDLRHSGKVEGGELKAWADARQTWSELAKIIGRVKTRGHSEVTVGDVVELKGVGARFNGKAFITAVRQELSEGEWYTNLQFGCSPEWFYKKFELTERPASGLLPGLNGLQIGIVKQLEGDPDGEERILVNLPIVDAAAEGTWARLTSLDAGNNRGFIFRPEIDDEVVVGFINDDPRDAIVLGMMHSSGKPAPIEAKDDNHEKGLVSRSEIRFHIDDDKKILTLETPAGNKLVLDEDDKSITMEDQNGNKLLMDSSGITIESAKDIILKATGDVTMDGVNIKQNAQAQFEAQGSAGVKVSSSAIAELKGSLVKIN